MLQRCVITGLRAAQPSRGCAAQGAAKGRATPAGTAGPGTGAGTAGPGTGAGTAGPGTPAAAAGPGERRRDHVEAIHAALAACGPQTIHELAARTLLTHVQVARRLPEMSGQAEVTSELRPGPQGRRCRVWRVVRGSSVKALQPLLHR